MATAAIVPLVFGLALLVVGAELLVRGATRLAMALGMSRLVIGLVVVALGTSAPEIAVSTGAALQGKADLALGNVVGSNVFNVLFILGATAVVAPLVVRHRLVRIDIPLMVVAGLVLAAMALDGGLSRLDGVLLLVLAVAYTLMNLRLGRKESLEEVPVADETPRGTRVLVIASLLVLVGLVGLVIGARLAVTAASDIARAFGASDLVIGLTIVAAGTSLPEVVTSVLAAVRGERDIAIGNVVGSNILNITVVLGLASVVSPGALDVVRGALTVDVPVMVAVSLALLPIAFTGQTITRWEGGLFLAYYVVYVVYLFLTASVHPRVDELAFALLWFVVPLTVIVLVAAVWQEMKRRRERSVP